MPRTLNAVRRWSTNARLCVATIGVSLALGACSNELAPNETKLSLAIGPSRVTCYGNGQRECIRVRFLPDTSWSLFYDPIEGFDYEPGYNYQIDVAQRGVANPMLDASSLAYRLIKVVSKERTIVK